MTKRNQLWTPAEDAKLRNAIGHMTLQQLSEHLNRSTHSINNRINRLKLRTQEGNRLRTYWTEEEDAVLRKYINKKNITEIARTLGRTKSSVNSRINVLQLERASTAKRWTLDEDDFLIYHYGHKPFSYIARKLNRSEASIESRVARLKLGAAKEATGYFEMGELANALNVDYKTVYEWARKKDLPIEKTYAKRRHLLMIDVAKFWKWADENRSMLNFAKISPGVLLPEPDWLEGERKKDHELLPAHSNTYWTEEQDRILWRMYYGDCMSQRQIAAALKRSTSAVQKRLARIRQNRIQSTAQAV